MGRDPPRALAASSYALLALAVALILVPSAQADTLEPLTHERYLKPPLSINATTDIAALAGQGWTVTGGPGTTAANAWVIHSMNISAATQHAVYIKGTEKHIELRNLFVRNGFTTYDGIVVENARNVTINHVHAENNRNGIRVLGNQSFVVINHTGLVANRVGIALEGVRGKTDGTHGVVARGNDIRINGRGVAFDKSKFNTFTDNRLSIAQGQFGFHFSDNTSWENVIPLSNRVNGVQMRWYVGVNNITAAVGNGNLDPVQANLTAGGMTNVAQFLVYNSSDVVFSNFTLRNGLVGLHVEKSRAVQISRFTIEDNQERALLVRGSSDVKLSRLTVARNGVVGAVEGSPRFELTDSRLQESRGAGLAVTGGDRLTFRGNAFLKNPGVALQTTDSKNVTVQSNTFDDVGGGILVKAGRDVAILSNTVSANRATGITVDGARVATVQSNTVGGGVEGIAAANLLEGTFGPGNRVEGATTGVSLRGSKNVTVANATLTGNGIGVQITSSTWNRFDNVTITKTSAGTGFSFADEVSYDNRVPTSNTVNGEKIRWYVGLRASAGAPFRLGGLTLSEARSTNVAQVMLYRSENVTLENPTLSNAASRGIFLLQSRGVAVKGATMSRADVAIHAKDSALVFVNDSRFTDGNRGLVFEGSRASKAPYTLPSFVYNLSDGSAPARLLDARSPVYVAQNNTFVSNARAIEMLATASGEFRRNVVTKNASAYAWWFDSNAVSHFIDASNTVNGEKMAWYAGIRPGASVRVNLGEIRVTTPRVTNLGQAGLYNVSGFTISRATLTNGTGTGLYLERAENVTVSAGEVSRNAGDGVRVVASTPPASASITLTGLVADRNGGFGVIASGVKVNLTIQSVTATRNVDGISVADSNGVYIASSRAEDNTASGVTVSASKGAVVSALTARNQPVGLTLRTSENAVGRGLLLQNHTDGLILSTSDGAQVSGSVSIAKRGLVMSATRGATVNGFTIQGADTGIELVGSPGNRFTSSRVSKADGQIAVKFDGPASYDNDFGFTTSPLTIERLPLGSTTYFPWFRTASFATGTFGSPTVVPGPSSTFPNLTNVAQIFYYRPQNLTVVVATATDGAADGIVVWEPYNFKISDSTTTRNAEIGIRVVKGTYVNVTAASVSNGTTGVFADGTQNFVLYSSTVNGPASRCVRLAGTPTVAVKSNVLTNCGTGLLMEDVVDGLLKGNRIDGAGRAIEFANSYLNEFQGTLVTKRFDQTAVFFGDPVSYNNRFDRGTRVTDRDFRNRLKTEPLHWYVNVIGDGNYTQISNLNATIENVTNVAQIGIFQSSSLKLVSPRATAKNAVGILVANSGDVVLEAARVTNATVGIRVDSSRKVNVVTANVTGATTGIEYRATEDGRIVGNELLNVFNAVTLDAASKHNVVAQTKVTNATGATLVDPTATATGIGANIVVDGGKDLNITLGASFSVANALATSDSVLAPITSQTWDWGDGSPTNVSNSPAKFQPSHTYRAVRTFTATFRIVVGNTPYEDTIRVSVWPLPPGGVRDLVAIPGDAFVELAWVAPIDTGGSDWVYYNVYRQEGTGPLVKLEHTPKTQQNFTDPGLENAKKYTYLVAAYNAAGEGPRARAEAIPFGIPSPPRQFAARFNGSSSELSWIPPLTNGGIPIEYYQVFRRDVNTSGEWRQIASEVKTRYSDANILQGRTYLYRVAAVNQRAAGIASAEVRVNTYGPPSAPESLRANLTLDIVRLTWDAPVVEGGKPISRYVVSRVDRDGIARTVGTTSNLTRAFFYTLPVADRSAVFRVAAASALGEGPYAEARVLRPASTGDIRTPGEPQNARANLTAEGTVTLTWTPPASNGGSPILSYVISRVPPAGEATVVGTVPGAVLTFVDRAGTEARSYQWWIVAQNLRGDGNRTVVRLATAPSLVTAAPGPATAVRAVASGTGVRVTWTAPVVASGAPVEGYYVYRFFADGAGDRLPVVSATANGTTDAAPVSATAVAYGVYPFNARGGATMAMAQVERVAQRTTTVPTIPRDFKAVPVSESLVLTWQRPLFDGGSPIVAYRVYRVAHDGSESLAATLGPTTTEWSEPTREASATVVYAIAAVNEKGESLRALTTSGVARAGTPAAPKALVATVSNGKVTLTWTPPNGTGATGYVVVRAGEDGKLRVFRLAEATSQFTDTTAEKGKSYVYVVQPENAEGSGLGSDAVRVAAGDLPNAPTLFVARGGNGEVSLSWSPPDAADDALPLLRYVLRRSSAADPLAPVATIDVGNTTYRDTNVTGGTRFDYVLAAVNGRGEGASAFASATPTGDAVKKGGFPLTAWLKDAANAQLNWTEPVGFGPETYKVFRVEGDNRTEIREMPPFVTNLVLPREATNATYVVVAMKKDAELVSDTVLVAAAEKAVQAEEDSGGFLGVPAAGAVGAASAIALVAFARKRRR